MVLEDLQQVGGRYEAYLEMGAEAKKADLEAGASTTLRYL